VSSARAVQTIESISAALHSGRAATLPELMKIIQTIARGENASNVDELAELVQKDAGVLTKVVNAANTLGYNPTGVKIDGVADAIHVLGFNRVRRLAMSMLLMEHAGRTTTPAAQREMAAISLCSGLVAQVAAEQMALIDPEQAFVCAALRNFGRLLLGTFMNDEFRAARDLAETNGSEDDAYRSVFGLTPVELGYELLKSSALPEPILNAIRSLPPQALHQAAWADRRLAHLSRFALQLSELALDPKYDASGFGQASTQLMQRFSADLPGLVDLFPELLSRTEAQLTKIARSTGAEGVDAQGQERYPLDRLRRRVKGHDLPARPLTTFAVPAPRHAVPLPPSEQVNSLEDACDALLRDSTRRDALRLALDAMRASLALTHAFYCSLDHSRGEFVLEHGYGPLADALRGKPLFRRHERNVFLLCHARLENVVVRDATEPAVLHHLPPWLRESIAPKSFLLLPVHHLGHVHGVILVGWDATQPTHLSTERLALVRKLLALVARAHLVA
jgi:HD-like signal output (HDOD) protein